MLDMTALNAINDKMHKALAHVGGRIDAVFFCPHAQETHCECRKPKPGLFVDIASRFNTDLTGVPCIGDALRDLQAASLVGAQPILVLTGKGKLTAREAELPSNTKTYTDLGAAVRSLVE